MIHVIHIYINYSNVPILIVSSSFFFQRKKLSYCGHCSVCVVIIFGGVSIGWSLCKKFKVLKTDTHRQLIACSCFRALLSPDVIIVMSCTCRCKVEFLWDFIAALHMRCHWYRVCPVWHRKVVFHKMNAHHSKINDLCFVCEG